MPNNCHCRMCLLFSMAAFSTALFVFFLLVVSSAAPAKRSLIDWEPENRGLIDWEPKNRGLIDYEPKNRGIIDYERNPWEPFPYPAKA